MIEVKLLGHIIRILIAGEFWVGSNNVKNPSSIYYMIEVKLLGHIICILIAGEFWVGSNNVKTLCQTYCW